MGSPRSRASERLARAFCASKGLPSRNMSGLDIAWRNRQRLAAIRDPRERYPTVADQLCEAGRLGQKTGAGWKQ